MKKIILIIVFMILSLFIFTGCTNSEESVAYHEPYLRFKLLSYEDNFNIYYDVETGVMYAVSTDCYNSGTVTVLVDRDGQPLIWKVIDE